MFQGKNGARLPKGKTQRVENTDKIVRKAYFLMIKFKSKFKNKAPDELVLITGASSTHQSSLIQLLESILIFGENLKLYVFDLGLEDNYRNKLEEFRKVLNLNIVDYDFKSKPNWMDISNPSKGEWSWKPDCIRTIVNLENEGNPENFNCYLWLDAGSKVISNLDFIHDYLHRSGFYSPASSGLVKEWTHPTQSKIVVGNQNFSEKLNLDGSIVGFCSQRQMPRELLEEWFQFSMIQSVIAPPGSSRQNHRQDQSLLTLLAYKKGMAPRKWALHMHKHSILRHQDID